MNQGKSLIKRSTDRIESMREKKNKKKEEENKRKIWDGIWYWQDRCDVAREIAIIVNNNNNNNSDSNNNNYHD